MALSKRWTWGLAAGVPALLLVAALPPRVCSDDDGVSALEEYACTFRHREDGGSHHMSVSNLRNRVRRELEKRSVLEVIGRSWPSQERIYRPAPYLAVLTDGVPAESASALAESFAREVARLPAAPAGTEPGQVRVVLLRDSLAPLAAQLRARSLWAEDSRRIGLDETGQPVCWVVLNRWAHRNQLRTSLGWCAAVARYGVPAGAKRLGLDELGRGYYSEASLADQVAFVSGPVPDWSTVSRREQWMVAGEIAKPKACADGDLAMCRRMLGHTLLERRTRTNELALLLLGQRPIDEFLRFWRHDGTIMESLVAGYGMSPESIMQQTFARRFGSVGMSPSPKGRNLLAALGWIGLALAIGMVAGSRRLMR